MSSENTHTHRIMKVIEVRCNDYTNIHKLRLQMFKVLLKCLKKLGKLSMTFLVLYSLYNYKIAVKKTTRREV